MPSSSEEILSRTEHRPWALPKGPYVLQMRWTDLLFAHWPVSISVVKELIPPQFDVDTFAGSAWVGVIPFRMEQVQLRGLPKVAGTDLFAEANIRTYVTDRKSGDSGVYFFSLDASNPLAVIGARSWYHLPYYFARMRIRKDSAEESAWITYTSRRYFSRRSAELEVRYRGAGRAHSLPRSQPNTVEQFLTERYALFTHFGRVAIRADIHHLPWTLEPAEAQFEEQTLTDAQSIHLPAVPPLLHFSRQLDVFAWPPKRIS